MDGAGAEKRGLNREVRIALLVIASILVFVASGAVGAALYFLPAVRTAVTVTGQTVSRPTLDAAVPASGSGGAFTILLLGSDDDSKFDPNQRLTQSMILARVDPSGPHVTMLSIPRDLFVPLASGVTDKIDKAYSNGGAAAAITAVEQNFHVHVDHYAWIGLRGLIGLIDRVGGIDIVVSNPVLDDFYPADLNGGNPYDYQRVAVLPGPQHLDGRHALEYVRSRHGDQRGDFGRSARQQQVLLALRAKARQLGIADLPDVATALASEFSTDMSVTQVNQLLPLAGSVPFSDVTQVVLADPYTSDATVGDQEVLLPHWSLIEPVVRAHFPTTGEAVGGG